MSHFHNGPVASEQEKSLITLMESADIKHGDTAEVELVGVGVRETEKASRVMCYCPATLRVLERLRQGSPEERRQPFPARISYARRLRREIRRSTFFNTGFLRLQARIHSNGTIHFVSGKILDFEPVHAGIAVNTTMAYTNLHG